MSDRPKVESSKGEMQKCEHLLMCSFFCNGMWEGGFKDADEGRVAKVGRHFSLFFPPPLPCNLIGNLIGISVVKGGFFY